MIVCAYQRDRRKREPNAAQARSKAQGMGWSLIGKKLICPTCSDARKESTVTKTTTATVAKIQPAAEPPAMTKRQRIDIISMLGDVYDLDAERYKDSETDDTVAAALELKPAWVAEVREAEFGPAGHNDEVERVEALLREALADHQAVGRKINALEDDLKAAQTEAKAAKGRLDAAIAKVGKIRDALSPRLKKRAGV